MAGSQVDHTFRHLWRFLSLDDDGEGSSVRTWSTVAECRVFSFAGLMKRDAVELETVHLGILADETSCQRDLIGGKRVYPVSLL